MSDMACPYQAMPVSATHMKRGLQMWVISGTACHTIENMPVNAISTRCALQLPQQLPCKTVWTVSGLMLIKSMQHKCTAWSHVSISS